MADERFLSVYRYNVHQNDGCHVYSAIADDELWQALWLRIDFHSHPLYNPPNGNNGKLFISTLAAEWKGEREQTWNSE